GQVPLVSSAVPVGRAEDAFSDSRFAHNQAGRKEGGELDAFDRIRFKLNPRFWVPLFDRRVDVERLADDARGPAAVLDGILATQDQLGVGLANAQRSHPS